MFRYRIAWNLNDNGTPPILEHGQDIWKVPGIGYSGSDAGIAVDLEIATTYEFLPMPYDRLLRTRITCRNVLAVRAHSIKLGFVLQGKTKRHCLFLSFPCKRASR